MGEGKPLGACASWTIALDLFLVAVGGAWRWPDRSAREATARIRLVLRLAPVSRFERFEKPSTSVGPAPGCSARAESIESRDSLRKRFFLLTGKRWDGKGTFWQEFRKMIFAVCARRAIWSPLRGSGSFCVSVAAISGVAAHSITRNPPRSKSIRRRSCGIASAVAKAETFSAS